YLPKRDVVDRQRHSFPTRRSSDLRNNGLFAIFPSGSLYALGPIVGASAFISQYGTPIEFSATYNVSQTQKIELAPLPVSGRLHIDRKSTRLNSSHVKHSYAVFCLK